MKTSLSHIGIFAQQVLERSKGARSPGSLLGEFIFSPDDDLTLYLSLEDLQGTTDTEPGSRVHQAG